MLNTCRFLVHLLSFGGKKTCHGRYISLNNNFIIQKVILFIVALCSAKPGSFLCNGWLKNPHKWLDSAAIFNSPTGIWNQLFITLITFALIEIMRLIHQPKKSVWEFLRVFRLYMFNPINHLLTTCKRRLKKSKGRQRLPDSKPIEIRFGENFAL